MLGGQVGDSSAARDVADVDVYDPATDRWSAAAPLPGPRSHTNSCTLVLDGRIVVIGGEAPSYRREVFSYDPADNEWSLFGMLPEGRSSSVAGAFGDRLIIATGDLPDASRDLWIGVLS